MTTTQKKNAVKILKTIDTVFKRVGKKHYPPRNLGRKVMPINFFFEDVKISMTINLCSHVKGTCCVLGIISYVKTSYIKLSHT